MRGRLFIWTLIVFAVTASAQKFDLNYKGQLSSYGHYNISNEVFLLGGRYLPQLNFGVDFGEEGLLDFEVSGNFYANTFANESFSTDGDLKPYRAWVRYSTNQFELRAGLQKINFGSANLMRPLMWFDQIDARDPLKLTDGVWGVLARYYFLNNANIWLWSLYGNENPKGWEVYSSDSKVPELGGRFQFPFSIGEGGLTYHHRKLNSDDLLTSIENIQEDRYGLDFRLDWLIGAWVEASYTHKNKNVGILTNSEIINLGFDYTIAVGSGLYLVCEQLFMACDEESFSFENTSSYSLFSASYPIGLFDNINAIVYYDWSTNSAYNFVNYQKQIKNVSLYCMAYWNPDVYKVPTQNGGANLLGGKGIQLMLVWNH